MYCEYTVVHVHLYMKKNTVVVKHKVKHLNCTCTLYLKSVKEVFSLDLFIHYLLIH